jgi:transcriptional regulator with XRE-family HTH domain
MTDSVKELQKADSTNSTEEGQTWESRNLISRESLIRRLKRGPDARAKFVDSHINKTLAFQIRSLRGDASQQEMMEKLGMNQNAISRLENPYYGKATLTTLKRVAAAHDVGLLVEFVPFSRLIDRVSGTPHLDLGLSPGTMNVQSFEEDLPELERPETRPSAEAVQWLTEVYQGVAAGLSSLTLQGQAEATDFGTGEAIGVGVPPVTGSLLQTPQPEPLAGESSIAVQWSRHRQRKRPKENRFRFKNLRRLSRRDWSRRSRPFLRGAYA